MSWWRRLAALFLVVAAVTWPQQASAATKVLLETRVWGIDLVVHALAGGSSAPSPEKHPGSSLAYDEIAPGYSLAAEGASGGVTTLYRTVAEGERAALEAGGSYEAAAGGVEGKYFYPTAGQAQSLARANFSSQGVQTLTSVQVPNSVLQGATQLSVAGEGRVIFFTSEQLSGLARPRIWNFFPIGGGAGP